MNFFIKNNYYFDIDHHNQLRIAGPKNHLFLGLAFPHNVPVEVVSYSLHRGNLKIKLEIRSDHIQISHPLVTDIRTLRSLTEPVRPHPTFQELLTGGHDEILPEVVEFDSKANVLTVLNRYETDDGRTEEYGARLKGVERTTLKWMENELRLELTGTDGITLEIQTITNIANTGVRRSHIFKKNVPLEAALEDETLREIYEQSGIFVTHLVMSEKTSSFEYGTIFPRDWIESADLGKGDLTARTVNYMYDRSMRYVSEEGIGWHEEIIGHFRHRKRNSQELLVDRKMIDIEPHYILGMRRMSKQMLMREDVRLKLQRIAGYVLEQATQKDLITFKPIKDGAPDYHVVGNWRDSATAFANQRAPIAPYDVNCVFYPAALRTIRKYREYLDIKGDINLGGLIRKWSRQKLKFRMYHPHDLLGYAIALQGKKRIPVPIAHLDESYDLFYDFPTLEEVVSFARKIVDPEFFYTPVGPILVAADEHELGVEHYHGKVIWPKQAAFAIGGLGKQLRRGVRLGWPEYSIVVLREAIIRTSEACFRAWKELKAVPELYYYDASEDRARLYTDQPNPEGQMSIIQLWSSMGARKIIREYIEAVG